MTTPSPIGIYVRVSRKGDREDERFHSPREQAERAEALIRAKGYAVGPVFEDIDVSGATAPDERPAMGRLLKEIKSGRLGGIAAFSLDRLSREPAHGDTLVRTVTKAGGVLLTPDIPDAIDSPTGEFTFGMLLQVAKLYRSQAGARFASAKERAILAGIPVGPTPFGYRLRPDRRLEVDPEQAPVVRELFERWARGDGGRTVLARLLNEATGRTWSRQAVPKLIKSRLYATGRMEYGELVSEWDAGAIVDEALWHAAQRAPMPPRPARSPGTWLLTGLLRCAACGYNLAPSSTGPGGKYRSYRCVNARCTARAHVNADRIERYVAMRTAAVDHELATHSEAPDLGTLEDALVGAERRLAQVLAPEAQDALGDTWAATVKARRTERDTVAATLGEARQTESGSPLAFRLEDAELSRADLRATLALFWREIRVTRRTGRGTPITFVARGPHAEAEVELLGKEQA